MNNGDRLIEEVDYFVRANFAGGAAVTHNTFSVRNVVIRGDIPITARVTDRIDRARVNIVIIHTTIGNISTFS